MPEWSIGAVSKTVDQLAGPRVRIPVSPHTNDDVQSVARCANRKLTENHQSGKKRGLKTRPLFFIPKSNEF